MKSFRIAIVISAVLLSTTIVSGAPKQPPLAVQCGDDGTLTYTQDAHNNRVPDFSYAGYMQGRVSIPNVPVRVTVTPIAGDNTARIQAAIDYVASLTPDAQGMRGTVLLQKGRYELNGGLTISQSGVVVRGAGPGDKGTLLVATGIDRRTLITIKGKGDQQLDDTAIAISDPYVPVNATKFHVADSQKLKVGDTIVIRRPCTTDWIKAIGMAEMGGGFGAGWKANTRDISWDRTITAIAGNEITIDVPITTALDATFGGGEIRKYTWPGRISQVGVEKLACESAYDIKNPKDEAHSWIAVTLENVSDSWVRRVTVSHFVGGAVSIFDTAKQVTVEDCESLAPVSEIGGFRRHTFFTSGQLTFFKACWSQLGRHDFAVGCCCAGPTAFVQCEAVDPLDDSGSIDSWASGVLFDNVRIDGQALNLGNRGYADAFVGWSAANSVMWQCDAPLLILPSPPTAQNWGFACWGEFSGDAQWAASNNSVKPNSLYFGQLANRGIADAESHADLQPYPADASTSPTIAEAARHTAASNITGPVLSDWIDHVEERLPIADDMTGAKSIDEIPQKSTQTATAAIGKPKPLTLKNGVLSIAGALATGGREEVQWWLGGVRPAEIAKSKLCLTRFVPGRIGPGLTDDLAQLTDSMVQDHVIGIEQNYGLWYDERDDDHERIKRMNGDVWPPFYELPFLRSGQGFEWDGLSKYDLTKYNPWYFNRLKQFATLCDSKGLVLVDKHFFQHNIIEAGAHWASCPWRSVNNINDMGFPEPPPYAGDKRIFMSAQFYDVTNTHRCDIYRAYFRHCLDELADSTNVIHLTGEEFTGPLAFMQFWLDTVSQWEKDTGKHVFIGLSATKDVQDAILADPVRAPMVSVIDIRYWWYQVDGKPYAPPGGVNLSPRQLERIVPHKASSFSEVLHAVQEYREKYPDKAVMYSADGQGQFGWAALMGGGSLPDIRTALDPALAAAVTEMQPVAAAKLPENEYALADANQNYLIGSTTRGPINFDLSSSKYAYTERWINPRTGEVSAPTAVADNKIVEFKAGGNGSILWLSHQ